MAQIVVGVQQRLLPLYAWLRAYEEAEFTMQPVSPHATPVRVLQASGEPLPGLYAAGEVAGFGGGGMHGYRSLEGTFLGGCLLSGRIAGRAVAALG